MNWANYTLLVLYILNLGMALGSHGKEKKENVNFWHSLIGITILTVLLYFGGWFN